MASVKQNKRRQKEILKEWKGVSSNYSKNLKVLEDAVAKAGIYFMFQGEQERDSLPGVQNDDIVLWQQHISRGQQQINGCLIKLREITKEHKDIKNFTKAGKVSLKRKSPRKLIKLEELFKHLQDYAVLVDGLAQNIPPTEKLIGLGNTRVVGGELEEPSAEKLREELVLLNSRWNKLNERILRYVDRCEKLVVDISNNYKALKVWMVKSDNMLQWLAECEKLLDNERQIANDQPTLEEQLQDNEEFMHEGREYQASAIDVLTSGEKIFNQNRLDKHDLQYVNKTVIALKNRWNAIEEHLEDRHNRIKSRLDEIRKGNTTKELDEIKETNTTEDLEPWRQKAENLSKSLTHSQDNLDEIDSRLQNDNKYETLKQCTKDIQGIEQHLLNQSSEELTEVSSAGAAWKTKKTLSQDDDQEVQTTVNVLHDKMSGLEEIVKKQKERLQRSTANLMNQSVSDCEQNLNELDNMSLENFSAVGSDVQQVQTQIKDLQVFEERLEEEENKFQQITKQFSEACDENMLDENNKTRISYHLKEMEWRYKELWREHDGSKQRILKGLLVYSNEVIDDANDWLNDAESRAAVVRNTNGLDTSTKNLEKVLAKQERLTKDTIDNEQKVKTAAMLGKTILKDEALTDQDVPFNDEDMDLMEQRLHNLKQSNIDNEQRLKDALSKSAPEVTAEVIEASEVEEELEAFPDEVFSQPKDEGFDEEHSVSPTNELETDLASKVREFNKEVKGINDWMTESYKMCDDFYKSMHDKDAWLLQEKVEERYDDLDNKQKQVDHIYEVGKEITTQSSDEDTTKNINEQMFEVNTNWRDCHSMLCTACEVQVQRTSTRDTESSGCCLINVIRKKFGTICMYN
ncbi:microtubule-actin cross-linking factor 1 [Exaiptasia diaphana]|uniref:Dystrophin n=1 Tax=Exaiptasia diaphana TaxID=2652724 RepID=A0A913XZ91_EXADI|nr:microtubule-actin cross-linking factor 1 [Exaiptasia diaphana]KXJ23748.1 hypothetical protein AC249_AIPGENE4486 [Exaiptasia diaphana]